MNMNLNIMQPRPTLWLAALAASALILPEAWADTRQDAVSAISRLHKADIVKIMPDAVRSADSTFTTAEHYFKTNELELSEQFYQLTLQKARGILAAIPEKTSEDSSDQQAAAPETSPHAAASPAPPLDQNTGKPPVTAESETAREPEEIVSEQLVGHSSGYTVIEGDTIRLVAAKLGVTRQHLLALNQLDANSRIRIGQTLKYNNRKIVPQRVQDGIIINIPDRTLYLFKKGKLAVSLPVALGVPVKNKKYNWTTPTGKFKITAKAKDPTWYVPPSIQSEMEDQGKEVIISIPPGPTNPLGKYAFKTSLPGILIHSTIKPWSIYSYASHGCIRVYPSQMEGLFKEISVNTPGEIIYKPVKLAVTENGRVFLEVHQDAYGKSGGLIKEAKAQIEKQNLSERVDWKKFDAVLKHKTGIAEDISL
jgi:lipoprotein-anchoring transpeptidase ErfK/SrfK